jgi:hypothetical protein
MQQHRVIYKGGDRTTLTVALVWDYEEDEYALASRERFVDEDAAYAKAYELATAHDLKVADGRKGHHDYLD